MRKIIGLSLAVLVTALFYSCNKDTLTDSVLIQQIATSSEKVSVAPEALPQEIQDHIDDNYFETWIESAVKVDGKGFEVTLGYDDEIYFNKNNDRLLDDTRNRRGICGHLDELRPIRVDALDPVITNYIATEFPNATIHKAKAFRGHILVAVTTPAVDFRIILVFTQDGQFKGAFNLWRHCSDAGSDVDVSDIRQEIQTYIQTNYPGAEVLRAVAWRNKVIVGIFYNGHRVILVFDNEGNFLFSRP